MLFLSVIEQLIMDNLKQSLVAMHPLPLKVKLYTAKEVNVSKITKWTQIGMIYSVDYINSSEKLLFEIIFVIAFIRNMRRKTTY